MTWQFRSVVDLEATVRGALPRLPRDIALVAAVPRSGLLPATLVALYLNVPLTDIDGLLQGRVMSWGSRQLRDDDRRGYLPAPGAKILVVDDSVGHGTQLLDLRRRLAEARLPYELVYAAAYVTPESRPLVDLAFETLPWGRCFGWNLMHHPFLTHCCVDLDGVLCQNPSAEDNDDGSNYAAFLDAAPPLFLPSVEVGWIVTGRLEKYRPATKAWLARHGVRYRELVMLDLPDVPTKRRAGGGGPFKARVYRRTGAKLFVESSAREAAVISERSGLPVLALEGDRMVHPGLAARLPVATRRAPAGMLRRARRLVSDRVAAFGNERAVSGKPA